MTEVQKGDKAVYVKSTNKIGGPEADEDGLRSSNRPWIKIPDYTWVPSSERNLHNTVQWIENHSLEDIITYYKLEPDIEFHKEDTDG